MFSRRQLEEKSRRFRELESASHLWEGRIRQLEKQKQELEIHVKQSREALDEHVARLSKQVTRLEPSVFQRMTCGESQQNKQKCRI